MPQKILIATFALWLKGKRTSISGMVEPILSFFLPKVKQIGLIDGPHPGSEILISRFETYKKGRLKKTSFSYLGLILYPFLKIQNKNATQISFKIRDFFSVLEWALRSREKNDVFISLEAVYTLAGILLKKLRRIKTVVYYVSDYSPNRYSNKCFNALYVCLDRFCAQHADFIWDVSKAMQPARIKAGLDPKKSAPVIHVPNALFPEQISYLPITNLFPFSLVYAGTLAKINGPDLLIQAMPKILKKFPKTSLHIFGSNSTDQERIQKLIKTTRLEESVTFHGFVTNTIKLSQKINRFYLGIAPYINVPGSHRQYGNATKLRLYLAAGLPIITTNVPPLGKEIYKFGAGLIVKDAPEEMARAVIKIFSDKNLYRKMRSKAIKFAKNNTWENTYKNALSQMNLS